jgi:predicted glycoside hydrolase/deacetylase ChbG (UPF0249 family)
VSARRLIVNADDLGLHEGINAGVFHCHAQGIVTSASLCANGVAFDDAVRGVRSAPSLDVGIHLTVVGGEAPLCPHLPTLAPSGRLPHTFSRLFRDLALRRVKAAEIALEMTAQVARVRDSGIAVSHLDSHQHVHLHPSILPLVIDIARRFGIRAVRAARRVAPVRGVRAALLGLLSGPGFRRVNAAGLRTPDTFVGADESGRLDEARLSRLIGGLRPGTSELLCHPGLGTTRIAAAYGDWGFRWDEETQALSGAPAREALARAGVTLASYRDL